MISWVKMYAELARTCRVCGVEKTNDEFHLNGRRRKDGTSAPRTDCKKCSTEIHDAYVAKKRDRINAQRKENYRSNKNGLRDRIAREGVRRRYGLKVGEYDQLFKKQKGCCAICDTHQEKILRRLDVDHCHETGKIRGLLCLNCNRGMGLLKDDLTILKRVVRYLQKSKK